MTLAAGLLLAGFAGADEKPVIEEPCSEVYLAVSKSVADSPELLLEKASSFMKQNPRCGCEVVKALIQSAKEDNGEKASTKTVAAIVEAVLLAAPEDTWKQILQCAVASAPDAIVEIRSVVGRLAPNNQGLASVVDGSPLDSPGAGGALSPGSASSVPSIVNPPSVTNVNPGRGPNKPPKLPKAPKN